MNKLSYWLLGIADLGVALVIGAVAIFYPQNWEWWLCYGTPAIFFMLVINGLFIFLYRIENESVEKNNEIK